MLRILRRCVSTSQRKASQGDLLEMRRGDVPMIGILLKDTRLNQLHSRDVSIMLSNGSTIQYNEAWDLPLLRHSTWRSNQNAIRDQLELMQIVKQIEPFCSTVTSLIAETYSDFLELHSKLISDDLDFVSVSEAAKRLFRTSEPSCEQRHCVFRQLYSNSTHYIPPNFFHLVSSESFRIRPLREVENLRLLSFHIQNKSSLYNAFFAKCKRRIITFRSKDRTFDSSIPPFTPFELLFIQAMRDALAHPQSSQSFERTLVYHHMMHRFKNFYDGKIHSKNLALLLQEIGQLAPWENAVLTRQHKVSTSPLFNTNKSLELDAEAAHVLGDNQPDAPCLRLTEFKDQLVLPSALPNPSSDSLLSPAIYERDTCEAKRTEFEGTAYIIDDADAKELDDAISVEKTDNGTWLHVHVADPTARIPPNHILALTAQLKTTSVYFPEQHAPMFSASSPTSQMDLRTSKLCLTFSAKIGATGEILDYRVSPGVSKTSVLMTYNDVDAVIDHSYLYGFNMVESDNPIWIREQLNRLKKEKTNIWQTLDPEHVQEIRSIQQVTMSHLKHRVSKGAFNVDKPCATVSVSNYSGLASIYSDQYIEGKSKCPTVSVNPFNAQHMSPSQNMVSEAMIIAGRVAARFCHDHKIPVPYRCQPSPFKTMAHLKTSIDASKLRTMFERVVDGRDRVNGVFGFKEGSALFRYMQPGTLDLRPLAHSSMGISGIHDSDSSMGGYINVTSPLRRYIDFMVHHQIKAHFMDQKPPFSHQDIERLIPDLENKTRGAKYLAKRSETFWMLEWARRREYISRIYGKDHKSLVPDVYGCIRIPPVDTQHRIGTFSNRNAKQLSVAGTAPVYHGIVEWIGQDRSKYARIKVIELNGMVVRCDLPVLGGESKVGDIIKCRIRSIDPEKLELIAYSDRFYDNQFVVSN